MRIESRDGTTVQEDDHYVIMHIDGVEEARAARDRMAQTESLTGRCFGRKIPTLIGTYIERKPFPTQTRFGFHCTRDSSHDR